GRCNAGILGDRQAYDGQAPCQHDHQGNYPGENRSVYEKSCHEATTPSYLLAGVCSDGAVAACSVGATTAPGCTFCRPATITRSPVLRPDSTTQSLPTMRLTCTSRSSTLLSAVTTMTVA